MISQEINGLQSGRDYSEVKNSGSGTGLGKDAFLTLLVTQLRNQDPLKPMEDKEFVAQLAQFSSLEEMKNISKSIEGLLASQTSSQKSDAVGFIGKEVSALGGYVKVSGGISGPVQYELKDSASKVDIAVSDASGKVIRILQQQNAQGGINAFQWDGRDSNGNPVADGEYTFNVDARDLSGNNVSARTIMTGTVNAVKYELGVPYLMMGSAKVPLSNVMEVR